MKLYVVPELITNTSNQPMYTSSSHGEVAAGAIIGAIVNPVVDAVLDSIPGPAVPG